ncbi:hypothetical protein D3C80_1743680 [compost metagenome]
MMSRYRLRQNPVENLFISVPQRLTDFGAQLLLPAPALILLELRPGGVDFIIAAPQCNTRVIAQPAHIVLCFFPHILQEHFVSRVHAAGKHKVLPYQQAVLITQTIEYFLFIKAAAPHPQHVHIRRCR